MTNEVEPRNGVHVLAQEELGAAARLLFESYRSDPAARELFGFTSDEEAKNLEPLFRSICGSVARVPGTVQGYFREGELLGVIAVCPRLGSLFRVFVHHPVAVTTALVRTAYRRWRHRIPDDNARRRFRDYGRLIDTNPNKSCPTLQVLALAIRASVRRRGIARELLDAVARDKRWVAQMETVEVNTWHPEKVAIYEKLGFQRSWHATRNGLQAWTLHRARPQSDA